jgi:methylglutaconyl-CoA hydratase
LGRPTAYAVHDGVATVTLDLPEKRNALSTEMLDSLGDDLVHAGRDTAVRVVVLTHTGPIFCAGADLSVAGATSARYDIASILRLIQDSPKPVVGRIAGQCLGGGVGLAAACDISFAANGSRFAFSEVRLGVAPAVISVVCLPKMRKGDATELFLTGARFDALRAAEVGLITRAVPEDELDAAVTEAVGQLLLGGPQALGAVKRLLATVPAMDRDGAFEWTRALSAELFASEEATAGIAAFRQRQPAPWADPGST